MAAGDLRVAPNMLGQKGDMPRPREDPNNAENVPFSRLREKVAFAKQRSDEGSRDYNIDVEYISLRSNWRWLEPSSDPASRGHLLPPAGEGADSGRR